MHSFWHWLLHLLTWASADPGLVERERARAAGCVIVAYAALAPDPAPAPRRDFPEPENQAKPETREPQAISRPLVNVPPLPPAAPCLQCSGTGRIYRSDGGWVRCPCQCPGGKCPPGKR